MHIYPGDKYSSTPPYEGSLQCTSCKLSSHLEEVFEILYSEPGCWTVTGWVLTQRRFDHLPFSLLPEQAHTLNHQLGLEGVSNCISTLHRLFSNAPLSYHTDCLWELRQLEQLGPVRFAEKTSRNTVPADLLGEKNTVPAEKTS